MSASRHDPGATGAMGTAGPTESTEPTELVHDEWMSESDALIWRVERNPLLRSTIVSVWILDRAPTRRRMDDAVHYALERLPRLRQKVIDDPVTTPRWADDPYFNLDAHYSWARLPGSKVKRADVLDYAARLADRSFDRDRPLWELVVIDGLTKGRAAIVMKVHHAIADGLGMVEMLAHLVDLGPDGPADGADDAVVLEAARASAIARMPARALLHRAAQDASAGRRFGEATLRAAADLARDPIGSMQRLSRTTSSVARVVKPTTTPLSPLLTARSMSSRFDIVRRPLADVKRAARAADGTVNDAFVALVLDGLWRYHDAFDEPCDRLRLHMPISVRTADEVGEATNRFVPTRMEIDVGDLAPLDRVRAVRATLRAARDEPALPYVNDISAAIGRLGTTTAVSILGSMMQGCDVTASNVPGPPFPVWSGGAQIRQFYAFGPLAGSAVNITLFSYDGTVHLAAHSDRAAVTDGELFRRSLEDAADALLEAAAG
ncbi:MAG: wax ester/triacylglycerol synthase domain-containing protein [Actinomycetota bacterium]